MTAEVSLAKCTSYNDKEVEAALRKAISAVTDLSYITEGTRVVIKPNLVSFLPPDKAATSHPVVLNALIRILNEKGAKITVGDSPGGLFNSVYVNRVYKATGMNNIEGAVLNRNFSQSVHHSDSALRAREFAYTSYLDDADVIINLCKLKTHGMMGMSNAVKNMFGIIPGTVKPEFHFKFPDHNDFADMLIDLNESFRPALCICDAVTGMEGNGPTSGTPRDIGLIAASENPYKLDLVCAKIIGLEKDNVPTLKRAFERGLAPSDAGQVVTEGDINDFIIGDFELIPRKSITFNDAGGSIMAGIIRKCMCSRPALLKHKCIGCGECFRICPAKAIEMKNNLPVIDRSKCIYCFCCQEFCPKGAMEVKRPIIARMLGK